ncbi:IS200/IS605 family accessory protein TnpB-related protein [Faecalibaculum rodentium]|jgi:IS605 OrfB family transposase|uniref:IS200/IS605 family accessory protein TnpB-related protein n=4 Tax=Faecalibaculum rodentium TaxID=1702221 RepID=UPI001C3CB332|nr:IS200/IS605 family accessory protein TnpB-related protein [Faecalibaculum rodentium]
MMRTVPVASMSPVYEQPEFLVIPLEIRLDKRLCPEVIACIDDELAVYSKAYRSAFARIDHGEKNLNQLTKDLQDEYRLKSRAANSIVRDAKARHQAGLELARAQARDLRASILRKKKRMKRLQKEVEAMSKKAASNRLNDNEPSNYRKQKHDLWRLGQLIPRLEAKLKRWKKDIENRHVRLCFGTKKLFKAQYHLEENNLSSHEEWKEMFIRHRNRMMYLCGKNDEKNGNQLCHLIRMEDGSWQIGVLPVLKSEKGQDRIITGPVNITHTPGLELLSQVFDGYEADQPMKQAISVRILRRKKGYYVQFFLYLPKQDGWNTSSFEGVIGLDFNADHIALCETDRKGNIIYARRIGFPGLGRKNHNYDQGIDQMRTAIKKITAEARSKGKDLIIEDLDFSAKKSDLQKNKYYNRMISQLAYSQYTQAVKRRCFKDNVDLKIVDPAYTSKKAEETVCREHGINVHLGAACIIARRGLGLF